MTQRTLIRSLPAVCVAALLAAALLAPVRGVKASGPGAGIDALSYPVCSQVQIANGDGSPWYMSLDPGVGIVQPFGLQANMAGCSLKVEPSSYVSKRLDLVYWNPQTLSPDPTTVALRSASYYATYTTYNTSRFDMVPPVITRTLPGIAEAPPAETALEYRVLSGSYSSEVSLLDVDGPETIPVGLWTRAGTPYQQLGGPHPVFLHSVCGGDGVLQSHYVVQSVMKTDADAPATNVQFIQKFRVPAPVSLRWVEFVLKPYPYVGGLDYGVLFIADAQGQAVPPMSFGTPLAVANFLLYPYSAAWYSHFDFPSLPVLQPGHDYWLGISTFGDYQLGARVRTGTEGPYFDNGIGPFFARATAGSAAVEVPGRSLNFRLIGVPQGTVGVGDAAPAPSALALAVAPNPTRGVALVTWRGARGDLRFEVLDARGRRVSSGAAGVGASGQWRWSGTGDDGRALPAGLYFVRARDGAGRTSSARVTLVR